LSRAGRASKEAYATPDAVDLSLPVLC